MGDKHPCLGLFGDKNKKSHRSSVFSDGRQHYCERCGEKLNHENFSNIPAGYVTTHDQGNYHIPPVAALDAAEGRVTDAGNQQLVKWLRNPWTKCDNVARGPLPEWCVSLMHEAATTIEILTTPSDKIAEAARECRPETYASGVQCRTCGQSWGEDGPEQCPNAAIAGQGETP